MFITPTRCDTTVRYTLRKKKKKEKKNVIKQLANSMPHMLLFYYFMRNVNPPNKIGCFKSMKHE